MAKPRGPMAKPYYRPPLWSSQKAKMLDLYYRPPPLGLGLGPPWGALGLGFEPARGPGGSRKKSGKSHFPKKPLGSSWKFLKSFPEFPSGAHGEARAPPNGEAQGAHGQAVLSTSPPLELPETKNA